MAGYYTDVRGPWVQVGELRPPAAGTHWVCLAKGRGLDRFLALRGGVLYGADGHPRPSLQLVEADRWHPLVGTKHGWCNTEHGWDRASVAHLVEFSADGLWRLRKERAPLHLVTNDLAPADVSAAQLEHVASLAKDAEARRALELGAQRIRQLEQALLAATTPVGRWRRLGEGHQLLVRQGSRIDTVDADAVMEVESYEGRAAG